MKKLALFAYKQSLRLNSMVIGAGGIIALLMGLNTAIAQGIQEKEIFPVYPTIDYGSGQTAEQLKRGEYLVKMGDCIACHTRNGAQPFSGGLGFKTPFGTLYSPNLTPDKETGIGNWTLAQFTKAMREGISPRGRYYYPAFPFYYFTKVTDQDIADIKAYLSAIPPIHHPNYSNDMFFPFNIRYLQLGWRLLYFHPSKIGAYKPDPTQSESWNRGAYLVLGLGHCDMCHTQMHYMVFKGLVMGAPNMDYHLSGSFVQGYYAPNITSARMSTVTDQQLADVFQKNKLLEGGEVEGPMAEANRDSLRYLSSTDISAIATYLRSVKSKAPAVAKVGTGLQAGKKIYNQYCAGCHLTGAGGAPQVGNSVAWAPRIQQGLPALYQGAIKGIGAMPAMGACPTCSEQDIEYTVQYMVQQSSGKTGATTIKATSAPAAQPDVSLAVGQKVYNQYCAACHNGGYLGAPKIGDKAAWQPLIKKNMDVLYLNAIHGVNNMPVRGSCDKCTDAEVIAAIKYMVNKSKAQGNYDLW